MQEKLINICFIFDEASFKEFTGKVKGVNLGTGEKHHKSFGFRDVIRVFFLVFFTTLTSLIRYVSSICQGPNVANAPNVPYNVPNAPNIREFFF